MSRRKVYRSGVLPYFIKDDEILLLFMKPSNPKYGGDTFQMAKGKHEDGESALEAGLREAGEELGLFRGNIVHTHELGTFLGRTTVFIVEVKDPDAFGEPHFETGDTKWMTSKEFLHSGRDLHKPVVQAAVRYIKERRAKERRGG